MQVSFFKDRAKVFHIIVKKIGNAICLVPEYLEIYDWIFFRWIEPECHKNIEEIAIVVNFSDMANITIKDKFRITNRDGMTKNFQENHLMN